MSTEEAAIPAGPRFATLIEQMSHWYGVQMASHEAAKRAPQPLPNEEKT